MKWIDDTFQNPTDSFVLVVGCLLVVGPALFTALCEWGMR